MYDNNKLAKHILDAFCDVRYSVMDRSSDAQYIARNHRYPKHIADALDVMADEIRYWEDQVQSEALNYRLWEDQA